MKIMVTGSRTIKSEMDIFYHLYAAHAEHSDLLEVVLGDCPTGADAIARKWCGMTLRHDRYVIEQADWVKHGKAAVPIRNARMINNNPDIVYAFIDKPLDNSRGTKNAIEQALERNIGVVIRHTF